MRMKKIQRGFTLIELMIVVAIIGILAAVAIPAFMDYIKRSKKTEASLQLNKLGKNAKRYYSEHSSYLAKSMGRTPARGPGPGGGCCGGPDNHCDVSTRPFDTPDWRELDFQIDEPTLFNYTYEGTPNTYKAEAIGDLDCDTHEITYTLDGAAVDGNPTFKLTEPPPNTD